MAEDQDFDSRTEAPTQRRREEAYEQGRFAISAELTAGVVGFVGGGAMAILAHRLGGGFPSPTRTRLTTKPTRGMPVGRGARGVGGMVVPWLAGGGGVRG